MTRRINIQMWCCLWLLLLGMSLPAPGWAGVPVVSDVLVTDVTDRSFSVVWNASEASTAGLNVFDSPACTSATQGTTITAHPVVSLDTSVQAAIKTAAENNGIMKVQVTGLQAATEYCVQTLTTSKSTADQTVSPATPLKVTTQIQTIRTYTDDPNPDLLPFANDVIQFPVADASVNGQPTQVGGGIAAWELVGDGNFAVTGFVGDGITAPDALVDFNNFYDKVNSQNINLLGNERIKLYEYRGFLDCRLDRYRKVPQDMELSEIKSPAPCFDRADLDCNGTVNILDVLRDIGKFNTNVNNACFNSDMDMDGNGNVNILDILYVIGKFGTSG